MHKLILRYAGSACITLLLASMVIFILIRLAPGDPIESALGLGAGELGNDSKMLEEKKEMLRKQHGLYDTIPVQYIRWLGKLCTFDLGISIRTGIPITHELRRRIPATLLLSVAALCIQTIIGVSLGMYSAVKAGAVPDAVIRLFCVIFASLPVFVLSLLLLLVFSVRLHAYAISSYTALSRLWLPAITLGATGSPQIIRMVRASMLSEFGQLYISAVQSRGLPVRMILFEALHNALLPAVTTIALSFAHLIGGAVVVESIFNWPGLGNYAMQSILIHDYPAIQGYTVLTVAAVIFINLLVEFAYMFADPRVRKDIQQP